MTGFSHLPIKDLLQHYRAGRREPEDVVRMVYARIREAGDDHVWIYLVPEAESLRRAREVAALSRDLPLFGIPFAVKDNFDVAGLLTTAGCPAFAYKAEATATVVRKALDAGAILIGKTNMDQFATGLVGTRSPYGACSSVFRSDYISGGSSSGSAVAVAKGEVSFSFGTDTAGSGRVPAAFNGIVGVKPTKAFVSTAGVVPACRSLDCVSIFAPDVESGGRVLDVIAGTDELDPFSRSAPQQSYVRSEPVIGVPLSNSLEFFGDETAAESWQAAVTKARQLGAEIVEIDWTPFREAASLLYSGPFVAERYAAVGSFVSNTPAHEFDPTVRKIILDAERYSAVDAYRAGYRLQELRNQTAALLANLDALLLPTAPTIYKIGDVQKDPFILNARLGTYTNFVNLLDLCGIALPGPQRTDGLPFGVTLLAPAFCDRKLLRIAHWWEGTAPGSYLNDFAPGLTIAVVGAHLSGQPLNWQLTNCGGELVRTTRTAPRYRLYALTGTSPQKPGLLRVQEDQQQGIEVELWRLTHAAFGSFVAEIPPPLGIGTLELEDGSCVKGFLCEPYALEQAEEITALGGWRNYLTSSTANK